MEAFGYQPETWPHEIRFEEFPTRGQEAFLRVFAEGRDITPDRAHLLCGTILEAYGLKHRYSKGSCEVLIDFLKNARRAVSAAERKAWEQDGRN
jgi:hypothetical protein